MKSEKTGSMKWTFRLMMLIIPIGVVNNLAKGDLVGLWRFDEGVGYVTYDSSGNENTGYLWANSGNLPSWIDSQTGYGKALQFGQTTSDQNQVYVNYSPELELVSKWTIAFWVRIDSDSAPNDYGTPIHCENYVVMGGASYDKAMYFWPTAADGTWQKTWQFGLGANTQPSLGSWHHIAVTFDGTYFTFYKDGAIVSGYPTSTKPGSSPPVDLPDRLGNRTEIYWTYMYFGSYFMPGGTEFYHWLAGALDDMAIFNECLSQTQIQTIMGGDFAGPWMTYEESPFSDYIWNPTFISALAQLPDEPGEVVEPFLPPNWDGVDDNEPANDYGVINATGWVGAQPTLIKYAASISAGDKLYQLSNKALQTYVDGMKFRLYAQVAGNTAAIGDKVGVRFYVAESSDPNIMTQISDIYTTITSAEEWVEISDSSWTAGSGDVGDYLYAEAYVEQQGSGGGAGSAYGYFDLIHAQLIPSDCDEVALLNHTLDLDFNADCFVNLKEFSQMSDNWLRNDDPEPVPANPGELLTNWDFYQDLSLVPEAGNFQPQRAPTGWTFTNSSGTWNYGFQNVTNIGVVHSPEAGLFEAAGGSVAVYIDPNTVLSQTVTSETISNGETYYLSAMVAGSSSAYDETVPGGNSVYVYFEAVDPCTQVVTGTLKAFTNADMTAFVSPNHTNWRRLMYTYTADGTYAGDQFRVRAVHHKNTEYTVDVDGWVWIGNMSIIKGQANKPTDWPVTNLLTNGDFEDVSNYTVTEQLTLKGTHSGYVDIDNAGESPNGWEYEVWDPATTGWNGMQCFMWGPSPQPSQGRIAFGISPGNVPEHVLGQKINSPTIVYGETYYLTSVSTISWSQYVQYPNTWPVPDPQVTVEIFWLAGDDISERTKLAEVVATVEGSMGTAAGRWITTSTSFTVTDANANGKKFYVHAKTSDPIAFFDDIYLGLEPWPTEGAYTCAQYLLDNPDLAVDIDNDCDVDLDDFKILATDWLLCNEPGQTGCVENWFDW
ncbi:MAG: LamG domain-containing protein [Sedimentisphaerales bacterium]|nr:LamG domain-containing protein [Sedimentisphaerales bacterium]